MTNEKMRIATHNGAFHADDIVGVAVLLKLFPKAQLVRTRDPQAIESADMAVDVGGCWDPASGRFDHHQKGFVGQREDGTIFASAGLVWLEHGRAFIQSVKPQLDAPLVDKVFASIDQEFIAHVDRADTGAARGAPDFFGISALLSTFNLSRAEEQTYGVGYANPDTKRTMLAHLRQSRFLEAVSLVQCLLYRLVEQTASRYADEELVRASQVLDEGRVLMLEQSGLEWENVVVHEMPHVLYVVYPDSSDQQFQLRVVPTAVGSFTARKDLPAAWAGLRGAELAAVTGVEDAVFCHNGRFIAGAGSKQSALRMAQMAIAQGGDDASR